MTLSAAFGMAAALLLLALTPGPGMLATVSRALSSGFRASLLVAWGIVVGDLLFLLFAIFGLSALASLMGSLFILIKYLGGLYLLWLGWHLLRTPPSAIETDAPIIEVSAPNLFLSGLFITLGNPKVILFYLGFLPTFVDLSSLHGSDILAIIAIVTVVIGSSMVLYGYLAAKAGTVMLERYNSKLPNRIAGTAMLATGTILLSRN